MGTRPTAWVGATTAQPRRAARMLALAQQVDSLVDWGETDSYAQAARLLGTTRARMSEVANLIALSPRIQEAILAGES